MVDEMTETATMAKMLGSEVSLEELWMPFTANRAFKRAPRLLASASGMYYKSLDGRQVLDGTAGLWCVNAGHCREPIVRAVQEAAATLDFAPGFQMGHPYSFMLAERVAKMLPGDLDHVFFSNSGSEAVDSALKIAMAYFQSTGQPQRTRFGSTGKRSRRKSSLQDVIGLGCGSEVAIHC